MASGRYVAYYRVSSARQGRSGLGLEAQEQTVRERLNGGDWTIVASFTEVETGTGRRARPELTKALARCRLVGAKLVVANVSRLTRDPDFMGSLVAAGVDVEFCDLPRVEGPVGTFLLRQMLAVAELEAGMIAERTRKALAAAKARGVKLGGDRGNLRSVYQAGAAASVAARRAVARRTAADIRPVIAELRQDGAVSLRAVARGLDERGIRTPGRGRGWTATQVSRILAMDPAA